jgi:hypothetical protein
MPGTGRVRIVNTNDFFGSFAPMRTSYGRLPGGEGREAMGEVRGAARSSAVAARSKIHRGGESRMGTRKEKRLG